MSRYSDYRQKLMEVLAEGLKCRFYAGWTEGPIENMGMVGYCYMPMVREGGLNGNVLEEEITMLTRVYLPLQQQIDPEQPINPEPLENLVEAIQAIAKANQTEMGPWSMRLMSCEINPDMQFVEATWFMLDQNYAQSYG